ncbi:MAG: DUF3667 domain-containing protein, partial [Balneolaceae bacterium]
TGRSFGERSGRLSGERSGQSGRSSGEPFGPVCLNCSTPVHGKFCSECGQEHRATKQSVWQLLGAFFSGLFNYDGRLVRSVRLLFTKPAGLTKAYMDGKRAHYVNPVQFYLFTSALYFLFANYFPVPDSDMNAKANANANVDLSQEEVVAEVLDRLPSESLPDDIRAQVILPRGEQDAEIVELSGEQETETGAESGVEPLLNLEFATFDEYLSHQATLPADQRNNSLERFVIQKAYHLQSTYSDGTSIQQALGKEIFQRIPQLLFFTLPLMALITKIVYFRRRDLWYIDHLIFILHAATSFFLLLFVQDILELIAHATTQPWIAAITAPLGLAWFGHYVVSFRRFFNDRWFKTLLLFSITTFWQSVVILFGFLVLLVVSLLQL